MDEAKSIQRKMFNAGYVNAARDFLERWMNYNAYERKTIAEFWSK